MSSRAYPVAAAHAVLSLSIAGLVAPAHAAQRTFVSTSGNDANACTLVAPCRGFAKAITVTDPGGELVVLDSGGYGFVTVNKNVTILSPAGVYAGISVFAAQDGITVAAPAAKVVLRGLTINGQGGNNGIRVQAGEVHVESVVVSNMGGAGILVDGGSSVRISGTVSRSNVDGLRIAPAAGAVSVLVRDSEFAANATAGIGVSPSAGGSSALVTVERSSLTKNGAGVAAAPGGSATATVVVTQSVASENAGAGVSSNGSTSTVFVRESAITRNGTGLSQSAAGILNACGANLLVANTTAQSGSINVNAAACLDQVAGGTVTNVATGPGLTGGPITTTGTINLAATNLLPTVACSTNQIPQWTGSAWICAAAGGTGTVTSVGTGTGLTGGPITTTGTITADAAYLQRRVTGSCATGSSIRVINSDGTVACETDDTGPANAFVQGGNPFGATAVLGTTDNNALEINVNGARVMRYEPNVDSPNLVAGHPNNGVGASFGQTVGGGGRAGSLCYDPVSGTLTRSCGNRATNAFATVAGGISNVASGFDSTVGGGGTHTASGQWSTVGGGGSNTASGQGSTVAGGTGNIASGSVNSTVAGGTNNTASGDYSTVAGGSFNVASGVGSFAVGHRAKTQTAGPTPIVHDGTFAFADSSDFDFNTVALNEFAVRATGGVRFVTAIDLSGNPTRAARINGNGELDFGSQSRQMINLSGPALYGIGVQAETQYARTDGHFTWFKKGTHSDVQYEPGAGGEVLMSVSSTPGTGSGTTHTGTVRAAAFTVTSDRAAKQDFDEVDTAEVLAKVVATPVRTWAYRIDPDTRHIGMTGQDFRAAFGVGDSEKSIATVDADGVALAAIQGLNAKLEAKVAEQARENDELRARVAELESLRDELAALRSAVAALSRPTTVAAR